jgi:hypothetical protein
MAKWNQKRHGPLACEDVDVVVEGSEEATVVAVAEMIVTEVTEAEVTATQMTGREDARRTEHLASRTTAGVIAEATTAIVTTSEEAAVITVDLRIETESVRSERMGKKFQSAS